MVDRAPALLEQLCQVRDRLLVLFRFQCLLNETLGDLEVVECFLVFLVDWVVGLYCDRLLQINACLGQLAQGDVALAQPVVGLRELLIDSEGRLAVTPRLREAGQLQLGDGSVGVVGWLCVLGVCKRKVKSGISSDNL